MESKPDQLAPQTVMPPKGSQIPSDVTSAVTDTAVTSQDRPPVHDSARPSSSTPVKQEGTAAQSFEVSSEVYAAMEPECGTVDTSREQTPAPPCMSLGTQVGRDLSYTEGLYLALPQSTDDNTGLYLEIDQSKSTGEVINQIRAELQLT